LKNGAPLGAREKDPWSTNNDATAKKIKLGGRKSQSVKKKEEKKAGGTQKGKRNKNDSD